MYFGFFDSVLKNINLISFIPSFWLVFNILQYITILGLDLPSLISGSFIIEFIFAWPGMGQLGIAAVFSRDYPILMGTILFSSILIIAGNLLADLAYRLADPRIRKS